ncbi:ExbD/TolR family protein [Sphingomonas psychrotolerans]|uniref:Biopolymer transporter ExbD n=1 Tax=Sphingomonas psychrotolerans TaxID=1327635 RepID=A0A2K8MG84_9SPHN|nr:biopolymer transporter ExbD [Sphingomonas psychrotolerans]ATY31566.1 biopolymer transporter ExbD [Sphingomonas psychrotolerans]
MQVKGKGKKKLYDDINITPMLDLAYVLLVIFIIMTTASVQGIKVNVPKASSSVSLAKPTTKAITVDSDGQVYLDTFPVTIDQLESQLRSFKAVTPDFPVVIKGDRVSQFGRITEVLDACSRVGISQLGIVTERVKPS